MKYAHITPIPLLEAIIGSVPTADFHLVVSSEILTTPAYCEFYRRRRSQGDFVILDSPAFETEQQADLQDTIHAVNLLDPSEVVLPDDMHSAQRTIVGTRNAARALEEVGYTGRYMMVPHGSTLQEFQQCATDLLALGYGDRTTIGLQEEIPELFGISRQEMINLLNLIAGETLTYHLLGVDEALDDQYTKGARSCDTAKFVTWGLNGFSIRPGERNVPAYPGRKSVGGRIGYFHYNTTDSSAIDVARSNVRAW